MEWFIVALVSLGLIAGLAIVVGKGFQQDNRLVQIEKELGQAYSALQRMCQKAEIAAAHIRLQGYDLKQMDTAVNIMAERLIYATQRHTDGTVASLEVDYGAAAPPPHVRTEGSEEEARAAAGNGHDLEKGSIFHIDRTKTVNERLAELATRVEEEPGITDEDEDNDLAGELKGLDMPERLAVRRIREEKEKTEGRSWNEF